MSLAPGGEPVSSRTRGLFGLVPQETAIFDGSLRDNITLFDGTPDEDRLGAIVERLGMTRWIDSLEDGLDTELNAGLASRFSGGQMQRIGLSRLLYGDKPIWILDEPSSGLDVDSLDVLRTLIAERRDKVIILITHSDAMLSHCDRAYRFVQRDSDASARVFECVEDTPGSTISSVFEDSKGLKDSTH